MPRLTQADLVTQRDRLRALAGSAIGSTIEWFDYFLYGTMAVLVFGNLFFPSTDPLVSQMLSLTTFALAFLVRPLGGIFFFAYRRPDRSQEDTRGDAVTHGRLDGRDGTSADV